MTSVEVEKLLHKAGFSFVRQKGSHKIFGNGTVFITVPFRRKPLKKGTLFSILKQAGLQ